jgi:hypothetical protein
MREKFRALLHKTSFMYLIVICILFFLLVFVSYHYFSLKQEVRQLEAQSQLAPEAERLTSEVGRLIQLPDEQPTIARVTNASKLKDQPFFAKAKDGDRVLIFTKAKKMILYRPTEKQIIEVTTLNPTLQSNPNN